MRGRRAHGRIQNRFQDSYFFYQSQQCVLHCENAGEGIHIVNSQKFPLRDEGGGKGSIFSEARPTYFQNHAFRLQLGVIYSKIAEQT